MLEILPINLLTDEDSSIFGPFSVLLGKLSRSGISVVSGTIVSAPDFHLKTVLEHFDFTHKEVFEQNLTLIKKELLKIPIPEVLEKEIKKKKSFYMNGEMVSSSKALWQALLLVWLEEIKQRLWNSGFNKGISENLESQVVIFTKKPESFGEAFYDPILDEVVIQAQKKVHPNDLKKIEDLVLKANQKLIIPHKYEWIIDKGVKLTKVLPYTPLPVILSETKNLSRMRAESETSDDKVKSTVKIFLDMSKGLVVEKDVDGVYISSEKIFDLNRPQVSFEELIFKLVECAETFPERPILIKLADKSEGMGKVRGTLRLLHQKSLFDPIVEAIDFARHKKELNNIHIVIPFVRSPSELIQIKRDLAVKKLTRKNSLQLWMEVAVPENIINLEDYLIQGVDGMVLNMDELSAHLSGYDYSEQELVFYKHEVSGLIKFLEDGLKLIHKAKVPFIAYGSLSLNPKVLEFLIEKGVYGIVVERYEASSIVDLLKQAEKRMIFRRAS